MDNGTPDCPWNEIEQLAKLLGMTQSQALWQPALVLKTAIKVIKAAKVKEEC